ncbi:MAG: prepilin peptidase, partial [Clostridia bacterium]|nr:prepilin peptidase [Clostridia bacterium]
MNTFLYVIIFIIGTLFGSFYTLAVYRIPKRQDITHTHSY